MRAYIVEYNIIIETNGYSQFLGPLGQFFSHMSGTNNMVWNISYYVDTIIRGHHQFVPVMHELAKIMEMMYDVQPKITMGRMFDHIKPMWSAVGKMHGIVAVRDLCNWNETETTSQIVVPRHGIRFDHSQCL